MRVMTHDFGADHPPPEGTGPVIGYSPAIAEVNALIRRIADTTVSVCIWGERGTGKRYVSRAIHDLSSRRGGPFLVLDCAGRDDRVLDQHVVGPAERREAREDEDSLLMRRAHTGTLVLDDLPALGSLRQARLLHVLRTRELPDGGATESGRLNIRVITTMSSDPVDAVEDGALIPDLYYRVAVVLIRLPALRERPGDVPLLAEHFLQRLSATYKRPSVALTPGAMDHLMRLPWPGNVHQLEELARQAFFLANGATITEHHLSETAMVLRQEPGMN